MASTLMRGLAFVAVTAAGYIFGITADRVDAQPPAALPMLQPKAPPQPEPDRRVAAYIYGNVPITREELGDFIIARGGHEKLELFVNKRIIEIAAAQHKISVTPIEVQAGLEEDLRSLGINQKDFAEQVLPRYKKTMFEWIEDVIKPRLLLTKMCKDRVKVTEQDMQKLFENRHGERRQAKIICWSKDDTKEALRLWDVARKGDAEFDSVARAQTDKNLAAASGLVKPVGPHPEGDDAIVVKTLFSMKLGEISGIIEVPTGLMCVKCVAVIPPDTGVTFDDKLKAAFHKELSAKKLDQEIPKCFQELKKAANPQLYLKGPPSMAEYLEGNRQIINQAGGPPK